MRTRTLSAILALLLAFALPAGAQSRLTAPQLATLQAAIVADPVLTAYPNTPDGAFAMADYLNAPTAPAFIVWRTEVPVEEVMQNGFVWTEVDALTNSKARIWEWMRQMGTLNASKPNVRQGLRDCFGVASGTYTGMLPHLKRTATRAERIFATGTGSDASPGTMTIEGAPTYQDVQEARRQ